MVILERFTKKDFATLISWVDTEEFLMQFAGPLFRFPLTAHQLNIYISDKKRKAFKVTDRLTGHTIGHAEIFLRNKDIAVLCRILIGNPDLRGKGYGLQVVQQLLEISFTRYKVEKTELNVFDWNTSAIRCYEKAGFCVNENKTKKRDVNGKTWTAINMTIHKSQWQSRGQLPDEPG